jgi:hypothetical protein
MDPDLHLGTRGNKTTGLSFHLNINIKLDILNQLLSFMYLWLDQDLIPG